MPDWWSVGATVLVLAIIVIVVPLVGLIMRRRWLSQRGWVFDCSLRSLTTPSSGWMLGVARFHGETVEWYRVFSWSLKPMVTFVRGTVDVSPTRRPEAGDDVGLGTEARLIDVTGPTVNVSLATSPADMMAFLSWVESAPPGEPLRS